MYAAAVTAEAAGEAAAKVKVVATDVAQKASVAVNEINVSARLIAKACPAEALECDCGHLNG